MPYFCSKLPFSPCQYSPTSWELVPLTNWHRTKTFPSSYSEIFSTAKYSDNPVACSHFLKAFTCSSAAGFETPRFLNDASDGFVDSPSAMRSLGGGRVCAWALKLSKCKNAQRCKMSRNGRITKRT